MVLLQHLFLWELLTVREETKHKGSDRWGLGDWVKGQMFCTIFKLYMDDYVFWDCDFSTPKVTLYIPPKGANISHCPCWTTLWCCLWGEVRRRDDVSLSFAFLISSFWRDRKHWERSGDAFGTTFVLILNFLLWLYFSVENLRLIIEQMSTYQNKFSINSFEIFHVIIVIYILRIQILRLPVACLYS